MATGTVVSSMQAGVEGASPKRDRAGQANQVAREARAAVMKAATAALHILVEEAVGAGTAVQAALKTEILCHQVVVALGILAAA